MLSQAWLLPTDISRDTLSFISVSCSRQSQACLVADMGRDWPFLR